MKKYCFTLLSILIILSLLSGCNILPVNLPTESEIPASQTESKSRTQTQTEEHTETQTNAKDSTAPTDIDSEQAETKSASVKEKDGVNENDFEYTLENATATITKYTGNASDLVIPAVIDGYKVSGISMTAFDGDSGKNIKSVTVSEGIEDLFDWTFHSCMYIEKITIPSTVKSLPTDWFYYGGNYLKEYNVSGSGGRYYSQDGILFDSQTSTLMLCPSQNKLNGGKYTVPDGIKALGAYAFSSCDYLNTITMPDSLEAIGEKAFSGCYSLYDIKFSKNINRIDPEAFGGSPNLTEVHIPKTMKGLCNDYGWSIGLGYEGTDKISGFTVYGYVGTEAEKYANENGFNFVAE